MPSVTEGPKGRTNSTELNRTEQIARIGRVKIQLRLPRRREDAKMQIRMPRHRIQQKIHLHWCTSVVTDADTDTNRGGVGRGKWKFGGSSTR